MRKTFLVLGLSALLLTPLLFVNSRICLEKKGINTSFADSGLSCGFTPVPVKPSPGSLPSYTNPANQALLTSATPQAQSAFKPGPFMGETRALRTIGDWRLYYFNEIPPVDFDNYMVLQAYLPVACPPSLSVTAICEGQDTIQVSLVATLQRGNDCQDIRYDWVSEAVTLSDKPVTWQIVATR